MKPVLHFAHGNGFPSPCYHQMLTVLNASFTCTYIDKIGHEADFPVSDNWDGLVDELLHSVKQQTNTPVIAVGHSLGGVLSVLAALKSPEHFRAVVLLDAPLLSPARSKAIYLSKKLGLIDKLTPAYRTRTRRTHWPTEEAAFNYLKNRSVFKRFTKACLKDYITYGMTHDETGHTLRFMPEVEYQIYRTIPHTLLGYTKPLKVPTTLLYGCESDVITALDRRYMKKQFNITSLKTRGSHLFPFEYPEEAAQKVIQVLAPYM